MIPQLYLRIKLLTDPIQLTRFISETDNSLFRDGKFTVTFFPQGNSSGGLIGINIKESRNLENYYDINVDPITGQTKIKKNK